MKSSLVRSTNTHKASTVTLPYLLVVCSNGAGGWARPGVKSVRTTQAPGIPPLAPHASLGIDDAQAASLVVSILIGVGGWARPGRHVGCSTTQTPGIPPLAPFSLGSDATQAASILQ